MVAVISRSRILIERVVILYEYIQFTFRWLNKDIVPVLLLYSISLVYTILYSNQHPYLIGADTVFEYKSFILTIINNGWYANAIDRVTNSCLSVSVLPFAVWKLTGWNALMIFKYLYPVLASFIPVITYVIARRHTSIMPAMMAGVLVAATLFNVWAASYARNVTGLFFLSIMILFVTGNWKYKGIAATITALCVVVSYYVAGLILIALLAGQYMVAKITRSEYWLPYGGLFALIAVTAWWYGWLNPLALDVFRSAVGQTINGGVLFSADVTRWAVLAGVSVVGIVIYKRLPVVNDRVIALLTMLLPAMGLMVLGHMLPAVDKFYGIERLQYMLSPLSAVAFAIIIDVGLRKIPIVKSALCLILIITLYINAQVFLHAHYSNIGIDPWWYMYGI